MFDAARCCCWGSTKSSSNSPADAGDAVYDDIVGVNDAGDAVDDDIVDVGDTVDDDIVDVGDAVGDVDTPP